MYIHRYRQSVHISSPPTGSSPPSPLRPSLRPPPSSPTLTNLSPSAATSTTPCPSAMTSAPQRQPQPSFHMTHNFERRMMAMRPKSPMRS